MPNFYKNRLLISGSTATVMPVGNTANRPNDPLVGAFRYNLDLPGIEYWTGSVWASINSGAVTYTIDNLVGNGTQTAFTMGQSVSDASQVIVFVGSIYQAPNVQGGGISAYTVSGTTITFTSAPPINAPINIIHTA